MGSTLEKARAEMSFGRRSGSHPIGKRISLKGGPNNPRWREIVGVVDHVKNYGLDVEAKEVLYYPHLQSTARERGLAVRTEGDPTSMAAVVRNAIQSVDAQQSIAISIDIHRIDKLFTRCV